MSSALWQEIDLFVLAVFVGFSLISKIPSVLHTPLMSATNAIHGVILVGALILAAGARTSAGEILGVCAVLLATMNVVGGYVVTDRMLEMFRRSPGAERGGRGG